MPDELTSSPAAAAGTFAIGGDLTVNRMGFGAMRTTGSGIWGPPADKGAALATLRRAVELGVNLIDTADSYGPYVSEGLIGEVLYPYPAVWRLQLKEDGSSRDLAGGHITPARSISQKLSKEV